MKNSVLQEKYNSIKNKNCCRNGFAIFGCGKLGTELYPVLKRFGVFVTFIDNDIKKQKMGHMGQKVCGIGEYAERYKDTFIVIAVAKRNYDEISKQLEELGLKKNSDYLYIDTFLRETLPLISYFDYNKVFVGLTQICVTERCTLKCVNCAHACNKVPNNAEDMSFEEVKKSADLFFSKVDIVKEFVLIGGEPFLYDKLYEAIDYIGSKYREKIVMFSITTNGTIVPNDELIGLIKKHDVTIRVSDYSSTLPKLKSAYKRLFDKLNDVKTIVLDTEIDTWFDYGFGHVDNGCETYKLKRIFDECATPCREVRGGKYYYCVMARSVSENLGMNIGLDEYFDLEESSDREAFLRYEMGYIDKGFLSMCQYCRGANVYAYPIPAAIQQVKGNDTK